MSKLRDIRYNCRQATFLIEKRMIGKISFRETIELRIHLTGCSVCGLFDKQSRMINQMIKQLLNEPGNANFRLDDNYKKQMHDRIEQEINKN